MLNSLNLKSDHSALEAINRLEAAVFAWKEKRITEQVSGKSPVRTSWSLMKDSMTELDKMELIRYRAEALLQQLKNRYPNLPHSFLDVAKLQYGKVYMDCNSSFFHESPSFFLDVEFLIIFTISTSAGYRTLHPGSLFSGSRQLGIQRTLQNERHSSGRHFQQSKLTHCNNKQLSGNQSHCND